MDTNRFTRTEMLFGENSMKTLNNSKVLVFGIGGVGSFTVEALARSGVGTIGVVDNDVVDITNINRQLYALSSTIGRNKIDVAEERCKDINPEIVIHKYKLFYLPDVTDQIDFSQYDYVVDAIDTITGKMEIIKKCKELKIPMISAMGAGNRLDPTSFEVTDIYKTSGCPLARTIRSLCKKNGIGSLKVVFSREKSLDTSNGRMPGSTSFVPPVVGYIIASEVIKDIVSGNGNYPQ